MLKDRTLLRVGAILFLAVVLTGSALPSPAAAAPPVACGDTITVDVTIRGNLYCAGDGLVIGANGVNLNLNGHVISGSGVGVGVGVTATGRSGLVIRNGAINGFWRGIALESTRNTKVNSVRLLRNGAPGDRPGGGGVHAEDVSGLRISGGRIAGPIGIEAVAAQTSTGIAIDGVDVTGRIDLSIDTTASVVSRNIFRGGLLTLSEANRTVVRRNAFTESGVRVSESNYVSVLDNDFTRSTIEIANASENVLVRGNSLRASEVGLRVDSPVPNLRVLDNTFTGHAYGVQVQVEFLALVEGLSVARNTFTDNGVAGLFLEVTGAARPTAAPVGIVGNRFVANGFASADEDAAGRPIDDGLHTNVPVGSDVVVARNRTRANADFGIEALPAGSVRDGRGNQSVGDRNGCVGVVCQ
jgi:hypothetical protein